MHGLFATRDCGGEQPVIPGSKQPVGAAIPAVANNQLVDDAISRVANTPWVPLYIPGGRQPLDATINGGRQPVDATIPGGEQPASGCRYTWWQTTSGYRYMWPNYTYVYIYLGDAGKAKGTHMNFGNNHSAKLVNNRPTRSFN